MCHLNCRRNIAILNKKCVLLFNAQIIFYDIASTIFNTQLTDMFYDGYKCVHVFAPRSLLGITVRDCPSSIRSIKKL